VTATSWVCYADSHHWAGATSHLSKECSKTHCLCPRCSPGHPSGGGGCLRRSAQQPAGASGPATPCALVCCLPACSCRRQGPCSSQCLNIGNGHGHGIRTSIEVSDRPARAMWGLTESHSGCKEFLNTLPTLPTHTIYRLLQCSFSALFSSKEQSLVGGNAICIAQVPGVKATCGLSHTSVTAHESSMLQMHTLYATQAGNKLSQDAGVPLHWHMYGATRRPGA
jgi:hypothetical protein